MWYNISVKRRGNEKKKRMERGNLDTPALEKIFQKSLKNLLTNLVIYDIIYTERKKEVKTNEAHRNEHHHRRSNRDRQRQPPEEMRSYRRALQSQIRWRQGQMDFRPRLQGI